MANNTLQTVAVAVAATVAARIAWAILGGDDTADRINQEVRTRL